VSVVGGGQHDFEGAAPVENGPGEDLVGPADKAGHAGQLVGFAVNVV